MIMEESFNLEAYLSRGVENVVKDLLKTAVFHPAEALYMARFAKASKEAAARRHALEEAGEHIPPFLIASITSLCNLHCAGCYARSLETCEDGEPVRQLSGEEWGSIFTQASELGISFILLAGGEPMVRRDVLEQAAQQPGILFPIFTNGTLLNEANSALIEQHRNLVPIFSIEGGAVKTDSRRGAGVYEKVKAAMERLREKHLAFGASITVTRENLDEVTSQDFLDGLAARGCKGVIYVEFVPTAHALEHLALDAEERDWLAVRLGELRGANDSLLLISFPGDEKSSGGCLAAGRGFFHINSHGGAEPCPFSPYSDLNLRQHSLREAMQSPLFTALRSGDLLLEEHDGGCVLFRKREQVEALLAAEQ